MIVLVDVSQLDAQNHCLQLVESTIVADHVMVVLSATAVVTQHFDLRGDCIVIGGYHSAVAKATQVLAREKTECTGAAHAAGHFVSIATAE